MRWDNLTIEADEATRLPGYRDAAVVRRFDAPEALDTRFYEVRARSALNHVPEKSKMPFRWTINPYRGCSHACVYCLSGDTRVLMADGSHRAIADLRVGDEIYGTARRGAYRRYVTTDVRAHWSSVKPAFRLVLWRCSHCSSRRSSTRPARLGTTAPRGRRCTSSWPSPCRPLGH